LEKDRGAILKKTVGAALAQSGALPLYLDLPVYDYVRQDAFEERAGEAQPILLLRAFPCGVEDVVFTERFHTQKRAPARFAFAH
jgi:hypothetical protein